MRTKPAWVGFGVVAGLLGAETVGSFILTAGALPILFLPKWFMGVWMIVCIALALALWIWFIRQCTRWGSRRDQRRAEHPGKGWIAELFLLSWGTLSALLLLLVMNLFGYAQMLRAHYDYKLNTQEMAADSSRRTR